MIDEIKNSKEFARCKIRRTTEPDGDDIYFKIESDAANLPSCIARLGNCQVCSKRFAITPYTYTSPNGAPVCADCVQNKANTHSELVAQKRSSRICRRENQSKLLDGLTTSGARTLLETCVKKVSKHIEDIEDFGDLPLSVMRRLSQILSRRRAVTPKVLKLFLQSHHTELNIYDCAHLETDDFYQILKSKPELTKLNIRFVTPMKDPVFYYMMEKNKGIRDLHLDSPNLVTNECWRQVFTTIGPRLESLKLWNLNAAFDDKTAEIMCENCTVLERLKLKYLSKVGNTGLRAISSLRALRHLSLCFSEEIASESLIEMISSVGSNLHSLSLEDFKLFEDSLLQCIHEHCHQLIKLRLTNNSICSDKALATLFRGWANPALKFVDFHGLRNVDRSNRQGPSEPIGLASDGFIALMEHSGRSIISLNVASCRHISRGAYETVFDEDKSYPYLRHIDVSFNEAVDDYIVQRLFRCCHSLRKIVVFGCFKIRDLKVPRGIAVIGTVGTKITAAATA